LSNDWQRFFEWPEEVENQHIIQAALNRLRVAPKAAGLFR